ncbi:MAG: HU family DNA-binding protein [Sandaracinus sp.]|nr:HU family DNA-binding protein [Sandaracinus sp.]MCB9613411.1 HU family DNA-binding protein [Sandaracinus sp.]MCB9622762.1 HU family DNA-binding protein [Sandaracinus sp.]
MNRKELVERLLETEGETLSRARLGALLDRTFELMTEALADEGRVALPGFGTFTTHTTNERPGRHPKTGEKITIAESRTVRFKPAPALKDRL